MNLAAEMCVHPRKPVAAPPVVTRIGVNRHAKALGAALIGIATVFTITAAAAQSRLDTVRQRGVLLCGSNQGLAGFGIADAQGNWTGFDVELCRAVAAAIFDDPRKVRFIPLSAKDRFTALQSGDIDVLSRNTTWTMSRDTQLGFDFAAVTYYDGQAFMVRNKLAIASAKELNGASICVAQGTTNELNVADYFRAAGWKYQVVTFATNEETIKAYESGRCDAITSDASVLASQRLVLADPAEHAVLPDIISKEPLGPVVRHGDNQWADIIRWTHLAMVNAEELGITRDNVDDMKKSTNPEIKRLLGTEGKIGEAIGLGNDWAYRIIKHVGNYGESFERNLGGGSPLRTPGDSMRSGIEAGCNTEFRSGNPYPRISGAVQATAAPVTVIGTTAQSSCRGDGQESEAPEVLQDPGREWHPARQSIEPEQSPRPQSAKPDRSG